MLVHALRVRKREVAAPDAGLVGDDEQFESGVRETLQRRRRAGEEVHVLDAVQIILFRNQRPVAVEKNAGFIPANCGLIMARMELNSFRCQASCCDCGFTINRIIYMNKGRLGILVGGGPAPGLNGVIAAATIEGINQGYEVIGFRDGFKWLAQGDTVQYCRPLSIRDVKDIHIRGGSILGTARTNPTKSAEQMKNVFSVFEKLGITALVTIGGDDTAFSASVVAKQSNGKITRRARAQDD